jgi:outer membrane protein TolC
MSKSDVEAVAARRANLISELARIDRTRLDLLAEDEDLQVAERVLRRLADLHYGEPAPSEPPPSEGPLDAFVERGLSVTRKALDRVRSAVERRTT